jgi:NAD(P)-dependent dehydrogenase (short-subunit alcohol dehydrogenase family)
MVACSLWFQSIDLPVVVIDHVEKPSKTSLRRGKTIMDRLKGKRALITGGTGGISLETADRFLAEGARLAMTGKNPATLETARRELGSEVLIVPSDASDIAAQTKVAEILRQEFGGLDILFVNAGVPDLKPVGQWMRPRSTVPLRSM